jgi:hypothetical protein
MQMDGQLKNIKPLVVGGKTANMVKLKNILEENRWLELKKADQTPNQKIGKGIREINYQLKEIEKFVSWYSRIKNESDLHSDQYWKRTTNHLNKIRERLMRLSNKMNNL